MTTPSGTFLSSQAQPGTFQPACLQGQRAHGWLWSQALGQRPSKLPPALPAGGRSKPRGFGSWGYSTCPQGPLVPSKSITASPSLPGRPCPKASSLDSPRQQQGRPAHRRAPRLCLCPPVAQGLGACSREGHREAWCLIRAEHASCPPDHRLPHRRRQAALAKCRPREPEANVESGNREHRWAVPRARSRKRGALGTRDPHSRADGPRPQVETQDSPHTALLGGCSVVRAALRREQGPCSLPGGLYGPEASPGPRTHRSPIASGWARPPCPVALPALRPLVRPQG